MKFFLGLVPPLVTKERIIKFQESFPSNKVPYFYEPHITLKAPSGLTEDKAWLPKVLVLVGNHQRFSINLSSIDGFDDNVLFLKPKSSEGLMSLHQKLIELLNPTEEENRKFYEGPMYHPHLTLGEVTWGGMTREELREMRKRSGFELFNIPPFEPSFVRVYQKEGDDDLYEKLLDIPFKL
jgi:2'-5' RNA ligase